MYIWMNHYRHCNLLVLSFLVHCSITVDSSLEFCMMMCNIILHFCLFFPIQAPTFAYFRPNCQSAASKALTLSTVITFRGARVQCRYERRCPAKCIFCFLIKMQTHIFRLRMKKLYTANVHPSKPFLFADQWKACVSKCLLSLKRENCFFFLLGFLIKIFLNIWGMMICPNIVFFYLSDSKFGVLYPESKICFWGYWVKNRRTNFG